MSIQGAGRYQGRDAGYKHAFTNLVTSDKNWAFAWFEADVGICCKTKGSHDSSCDVHTDDMTRKIETTAEVESSGKSPTSPDSK